MTQRDVSGEAPLRVCSAVLRVPAGEAEAVRDSLFAVAGELDPRLFGRTVFPYHDKPTPRRLKKA